MRREDAGINSPVADGKQFDFQNGETPDAEAERKLARMTTTHKPNRQPKQQASQGWCSCFSMCFGSSEEGGTAEANMPPAHLMTQVARPDKTQTRNTQPVKGAAGGSEMSSGPQTSGRSEADRSGLQSPKSENFSMAPGTGIEMTDNKRPAAAAGRGARPATASPRGGNEIEQYAFKTNNPAIDGTDPKGLLAPNNTKFKKTLVLDLDETLVHSSFRPIPNPTFIIPVHIDNHVYNVYVLKRPYTDIFLERAAKCYEIIIFTASLAKYADPLLDELDKKHTINGRLFRNSCVMSGKTYVKDLSVLGRQLKNTILVDNSPLSYQFQPKCAVNCTSWFDDPDDTELLDMLPLLETTLLETDDVRNVLDADSMTYDELMKCAKRDTNTGREPMWGFSDGTGC